MGEVKLNFDGSIKAHLKENGHAFLMNPSRIKAIEAGPDGGSEITIDAGGYSSNFWVLESPEEMQRMIEGEKNDQQCE